MLGSDYRLIGFLLFNPTVGASYLKGTTSSEMIFVKTILKFSMVKDGRKEGWNAGMEVRLEGRLEWLEVSTTGKFHFLVFSRS